MAIDKRTTAERIAAAKAPMGAPAHGPLTQHALEAMLSVLHERILGDVETALHRARTNRNLSPPLREAFAGVAFELAKLTRERFHDRSE